MFWHKRIPIFLLASLFLVILTVDSTVQASPPQITVPAGFELVASAPGIALYKKDYAGGNPDFVQVIDLSEGAAVELFHGSVGGRGSKPGIYDGPNPTIGRQNLTALWNTFAAGNDRAFCLSNGQFFSPTVDPTELAFPLKRDGLTISEGYERNYLEQGMMLELWPGQAAMRTLSKSAFYSSTAPDIIAGLSAGAPIGSDGPTGRTFIGLADRVGEGRYGTVLIFNTKTSSQSEPPKVLESFGAEQIMMLDGGGSTQLICQGSGLVESDEANPRTLPQTIGSVAAQGAAQSVQLVDKTDLKVVVEGESIEIAVTLKNAGTESWRPETDKLVNRSNPWGAGPSRPLREAVLPGGKVLFSWETDPLTGSGIKTSKWYMARGEQAFAGDTVEIRVIVLPEQLSDKKKELEEQIATWSAGAIEDIEKLAKQWIQEQVSKAARSISPCNSTIPLLLVALAFGSRKRFYRTTKE